MSSLGEGSACSVGSAACSVGSPAGSVVEAGSGSASTATASDPAEAGVRRDAVLTALQQLPTRQREVLVLRYYLDLDEAGIAAALGISRGAVKSHASRGAAALRERLGDDDGRRETPEDRA